MISTISINICTLNAYKKCLLKYAKHFFSFVRIMNPVENSRASLHG